VKKSAKVSKKGKFYAFYVNIIFAFFRLANFTDNISRTNEPAATCGMDTKEA